MLKLKEHFFYLQTTTGKHFRFSASTKSPDLKQRGSNFDLIRFDCSQKSTNFYQRRHQLCRRRVRLETNLPIFHEVLEKRYLSFKFRREQKPSAPTLMRAKQASHFVLKNPYKNYSQRNFSVRFMTMLVLLTAEISLFLKGCYIKDDPPKINAES